MQQRLSLPSPHLRDITVQVCLLIDYENRTKYTTGEAKKTKSGANTKTK